MCQKWRGGSSPLVRTKTKNSIYVPVKTKNAGAHCTLKICSVEPRSFVAQAVGKTGPRGMMVTNYGRQWMKIFAAHRGCASTAADRSSPFDALVEAFPYFGTSTTALLGDLSRAIAFLGKRSGIFLSPEVAADCRAVDTSMAGFWIPAPIHGDRAGSPAVPQATDHSVKTVDSSPTVRCPKHYAALPTVVPHRAFREST